MRGRPSAGSVPPTFVKERCMDCGGCVGACPHDSIDLFQGFISIRASCTDCDLCVRLCPVEALAPAPGVPSLRVA